MEDASPQQCVEYVANWSFQTSTDFLFEFLLFHNLKRQNCFNKDRHTRQEELQGSFPVMRVYVRTRVPHINELMFQSLRDPYAYIRIKRVQTARKRVTRKRSYCLWMFAVHAILKHPCNVCILLLGYLLRKHRECSAIINLLLFVTILVQMF